MKNITQLQKRKRCIACERAPINCPRCEMIARGIFAAAMPRFHRRDFTASPDWVWKPSRRI